MFWYDGNYKKSSTLELEIADPGLLYGATVFTTLRIYQESLDNPLTNWQGHCLRLRVSLETFAWPQPDWERLREGAETMMATCPVLRIAIFPDGRELIAGRALPADLSDRQNNGIRAWLADAGPTKARPIALKGQNPDDNKSDRRSTHLYIYRSLPTHKTGNYLACYLALQEAKRRGTQEAIFTDDRGNWLETTTGNLWGWRNDRWWTPPVEAGILPGLMRSQLIDWLEQNQRPAIEEPWTPETVEGLEAIGYSNSVVGIIPIRQILSTRGTLTYSPSHPGFGQLRSLFQ